MIIVDLDNCISDDSWRWPHILKDQPHTSDKKYHDYHRLSMHDRFHLHNYRAILASAEYCRCDSQWVQRYGTSMLIATARPEFFRKQTEAWLHLNLGFRPPVMMRANGDKRGSVAVKADMLGIALALGLHITKAYDDRKDICDMYAERGIPSVRTFITDEAHP